MRSSFFFSSSDHPFANKNDCVFIKLQISEAPCVQTKLKARKGHVGFMLGISKFMLGFRWVSKKGLLKRDGRCAINKGMLYERKGVRRT